MFEFGLFFTKFGVFTAKWKRDCIG